MDIVGASVLDCKARRCETVSFDSVLVARFVPCRFHASRHGTVCALQVSCQPIGIGRTTRGMADDARHGGRREAWRTTRGMADDARHGGRREAWRTTRGMAETGQPRPHRTPPHRTRVRSPESCITLRSTQTTPHFSNFAPFVSFSPHRTPPGTSFGTMPKIHI
jgi:hypothetical protein